MSETGGHARARSFRDGFQRQHNTREVVVRINPPPAVLIHPTTAEQPSAESSTPLYKEHGLAIYALQYPVAATRTKYTLRSVRLHKAAPTRKTEGKKMRPIFSFDQSETWPAVCPMS